MKKGEVKKAEAEAEGNAANYDASIVWSIEARVTPRSTVLADTPPPVHSDGSSRV